MTRICLITIFTMFFGISAHASTVTLSFDKLQNVSGSGCGPDSPQPSEHFEQGYTVAGCPQPLFSAGKVHLDDEGSTSLSSSITITQAGPFDVLGLELTGHDSNWIPNDVGPGVAYNNVLFEGTTSFGTVTTLYYSTGATAGVLDVLFGNLFTDVTSFTITQVVPSAAELHARGASFVNCAPCNHVDVDNIQVAAAP